MHRIPEGIPEEQITLACNELVYKSENEMEFF